jgi:DNA-directed RNA polymerase specialized sigma24 family protein
VSDRTAITESTLLKLRERVRRHLKYLGHNSQLAEDAAQEYCLRLLQGLSGRQTIDQFCIDYLREHGPKSKAGVEREVLSATDKPLPDIAVDSTARLEAHIDFQRMLGWAKSGRDQQILTMLRDGSTLEEIGITLGVTEARVSQLAKRIFGQLRNVKPMEKGLINMSPVSRTEAGKLLKIPYQVVLKLVSSGNAESNKYGHIINMDQLLSLRQEHGRKWLRHLPKPMVTVKSERPQKTAPPYKFVGEDPTPLIEPAIDVSVIIESAKVLMTAHRHDLAGKLSLYGLMLLEKQR